MSNANNYPSCIKIPSSNSKQSTTITMLSQKFDVKETMTLNNELISLANRLFGEGKWSHTVTNQTIDFVESFGNKHVCGCVTFVKIQLQDGTYHEDMGYCHAEGAMKGLSIHYARIGSLADAFKKVLSCFGNAIVSEIQKLMKNLSNSHTNNVRKEDPRTSISSLRGDMPEPCAQSTPIVNHKNEEQKDKPEVIHRSRSLNEQKEQIPVQHTLTRSKSPSEQKENLRSLNEMNDQLQTKCSNHQKEQDTVQKERDQKKVLSEEELLRMERKRKQMEKQAEYKRLMMEKEQQKSTETKKLNRKY